MRSVIAFILIGSVFPASALLDQSQVARRYESAKKTFFEVRSKAASAEKLMISSKEKVERIKQQDREMYSSAFNTIFSKGNHLSQSHELLRQWNDYRRDTLDPAETEWINNVDGWRRALQILQKARIELASAGFHYLMEKSRKLNQQQTAGGNPSK